MSKHQLELPGLSGSAPKPKTKIQELFALIEQVSKRASSQGRSRISAIELHAHGYAEPGYKNPESGIIATGNWNTLTHYVEATRTFAVDDASPKELADMLEEQGVDLEWSDEWTECALCGKLVRTSQDSYGWKPCYWVDEADCEVVCVHCLKADASLLERYLESLVGVSSKAVMLDLDLTKHDYTKVNGDFENGWHEGQDDDPKAIAAALAKFGITKFIFKIPSVGQFDVRFEVYVHKSQIKKFNLEKFHAEPRKQYPSPAEVFKKQLQSIPA